MYTGDLLVSFFLYRFCTNFTSFWIKAEFNSDIQFFAFCPAVLAGSRFLFSPEQCHTLYWTFYIHRISNVCARNVHFKQKNEHNVNGRTHQFDILFLTASNTVLCNYIRLSNINSFQRYARVFHKMSHHVRCHAHVLCSAAIHRPLETWEALHKNLKRFKICIFLPATSVICAFVCG